LSLTIMFVAYLSSRVRAAGWLAAAALAAGSIEVAVKLASASPMLATYLLRDELSPHMARVLFNMNSTAFLMTWLPAGIFVACAAAAAICTGTLGRARGWGGILAGSSCVVVTAATRRTRYVRGRHPLDLLHAVGPAGEPAPGPQPVTWGHARIADCIPRRSISRSVTPPRVLPGPAGRAVGGCGRSATGRLSDPIGCTTETVERRARRPTAPVW
jgi:hypothetical protein